nr:hypothetical protein [Iodobacter ciconiae]
MRILCPDSGYKGRLSRKELNDGKTMIPAPHLIAAQVSAALQEDLGICDWTAMLIADGTQGAAVVIARQSAVICGQAWFDEVFRQVDTGITVKWLVNEGEQVVADQPLCRVEGAACSLLTAERSALNFLQTLSAVATETRRYVGLVAHTPAKIYDTRKTLPGLRLAQKYAVTVGEGKISV